MQAGRKETSAFLCFIDDSAQETLLHKGEKYYEL